MIMYPGATWESHQVNAAWNPLASTATNTPYVSRGEKNLGEAPLYKSRNEQALLTDKMVMPGFGHLPTGLVMGIVSEGEFVGQIFPADFAITATSASGTSVVVAEEYAPFFRVGMSIKSGDAAVAITAINVADGAATLTVDGEVSGTTISYPYEHVVVLDQPVYSDDKGAYTSAIYSNAVLYKSKMKNLSEATLALLGFADGPYVIVK